MFPSSFDHIVGQRVAQLHATADELRLMRGPGAPPPPQRPSQREPDVPR